MHQQSTRVRPAYLIYLAPVIWGMVAYVATHHLETSIAVALGMAGGLGIGLNHDRPIT